MKSQTGASFSLIVPSLIAAMAFALASCAKSSSAPFFDPGKADASAHAALVQARDIYGSGWEVTAQDKFDDTAGASFEQVALSIPQCSDLLSLSIFGEQTEDRSVGRAKIEIRRSRAGALLPSSIDEEISIKPTVVEVQGGWEIAKSLLQSDEGKACMARAFKAGFQQGAGNRGIEVIVEPIPAAMVAPHNGAYLGFKLSIRIGRSPSFDGVLHTFLWQYANAEVTAIFAGSDSDLTNSRVTSIIKTMDRKIVEKEKHQPTTPFATFPPSDRYNCSEIRGTAYRSEAERQWFLANCGGAPR